MSWNWQVLRMSLLAVCMASTVAFAGEPTTCTVADASGAREELSPELLGGTCVRYENVEALSSEESALPSYCEYQFTWCDNAACSTGSGAQGAHVYDCFTADGTYTGSRASMTCCGG